MTGLVSRSKLAAAFFCSAILVSSVSAQPKAPQRAKTNEKVTTADGWELPMTYYAVFNKEAPVILLLQGRKGRQQVWEKLLAEDLWKSQGYAVITVDVRESGKATWLGRGKKPKLRPPQFYTRLAANDIESIKEFIYVEHQKKHLNMRKMAIVGCDEMANVAMSYAIFDWMKKPFNDAPTGGLATPRGQDVQVLVLVSPSDRLQIPVVNVKQMSLGIARAGWPISVLSIYGTQDRDGWKATNTIYKTMKDPKKFPGSENRIAYRDYKSKRRGQDLLRENQKALLPILHKLFATKLKEMNAPWRDRKSRLFD